jgi:hypothetical protein
MIQSTRGQLKNIFETRELDEKSVCRDFRHTAEDGKDYMCVMPLSRHREERGRPEVDPEC